MFFNRYVLSLVIAALVSLSSLILVLSRLDPFAEETLAIVLFFVSLFFSLTSVFSLLGYLLRLAFYREELFLNHFNVSLRQGIIIALSLSGLMGFQVMRTLTWWNALIIVIIGFLIEVYFVARD
ncbi:MAG: hypothetical protein Q8O95_05360 [bacterium]|nr:hypothetical protein [bacterium]